MAILRCIFTHEGEIREQELLRHLRKLNCEKKDPDLGDVPTLLKKLTKQKFANPSIAQLVIFDRVVCFRLDI